MTTAKKPKKQESHVQPKTQKAGKQAIKASRFDSVMPGNLLMIDKVRCLVISTTDTTIVTASNGSPSVWERSWLDSIPANHIQIV